MTLGYTPACTDRMHTASGTLTTLLPVAAAAPDTNAMAPAWECTGALRVWVSTGVHCSSCLAGEGRGSSPLLVALAAAETPKVAAQGSAFSLRRASIPGCMLVCRRMACLAEEYIAK